MNYDSLPFSISSDPNFRADYAKFAILLVEMLAGTNPKAIATAAPFVIEYALQSGMALEHVSQFIEGMITSHGINPELFLATMKAVKPENQFSNSNPKGH